MPDAMMVYVVTRWMWGGGGDDKTEIVGVFSTRENAHAATLVYGEDCEVRAMVLDWVPDVSPR